jgi:hypothetical protein
MAEAFLFLAVSHVEMCSRAGGEAVVVRIAASHVQCDFFSELSLRAVPIDSDLPSTSSVGWSVHSFVRSTFFISFRITQGRCWTRTALEELLPEIMDFTRAAFGNLERTMAAKADIIWRIGLVDQLLTFLQELRRSLMEELERIEEEEASALKAEALQALLGEIKDGKLERFN